MTREVEILRPKNLFIAYLLCLLLGILGAHKFYLNRPLLGVLYFFSGGLILVGWIYDIFTLPRQINEYNERIYEFLDSHEQEIEDLEDEIDELYDRLKENNPSQDLEIMKAKVKHLEAQLNLMRSKSGETESR